MPQTRTDAEIKQTMKIIASTTTLTLTDARIDQDLAAYKGHLAAIDAIRSVTLPLEAEPAAIVVMKKS